MTSEEEISEIESNQYIHIGESLEEVVAQHTYFEGCDACERYRSVNASLEKIEHHVRSFHCTLAVSRPLKDGRKVFSLPCRRGCMVRGGENGKRSHYHCPFCLRMCGRRNNMVTHFKLDCSKMKNWKQPQRHPPDFGKSRDADESHSEDLPAPVFQESDDSGMFTAQTAVITIMETRLNEWIQDQRLFGRTVNLSNMLQRARSLHEKAKSDLGLVKSKPFYAGKQWVKSFLERFGMRDTMVVTPDNTDVFKPPEKDIILKVIEKVAGKPVLFDPLVAALEDHSEENEEAIWNEIAEAVGLDSGIIAKQIWDNIERKYQERTKPGRNPCEPWEYEHYLKFLPAELILDKCDIAREMEIETSGITDVGRPHKKMVTVSIQRDPEAAVEYEEDAIPDRRVNLAKLRKVHMQMDLMQQEHNVKMEMLQIQKDILMKKLNGLG